MKKKKRKKKKTNISEEYEKANHRYWLAWIQEAWKRGLQPSHPEHEHLLIQKQH